jgi:hypothetical protein
LILDSRLPHTIDTRYNEVGLWWGPGSRGGC